MTDLFSICWHWTVEHCRFYVDYAHDQWDNITPVTYTTLLVGIAVIGFVMMGRGNKR